MRSLVYRNPLGNILTLYREPYLLTAIDGIEMPTVNTQTQSAPYQDGVTDIDALFSARTITVSGTILLQDLPSIYQNRASVQSQLNPKLGMGVLTYTNDDGIYTTACRCIAATFPNKEFTNPFQSFQLQFFCPDPYWYAVDKSSILMQIVSGGFTFPMTFPVVLGTYSGSIPVIASNVGDSLTPVLITVNGPTANPVIKNNTTGDLIKLNTTIEQGDSIVINTKFGSKSVTRITSGGVTSNVSNTLDASSTFWQLQIGDNSIQFSDDYLMSLESCTVSWYNRYIGK